VCIRALVNEGQIRLIVEAVVCAGCVWMCAHMCALKRAEPNQEMRQNKRERGKRRDILDRELQRERA